MRKHSNTEKRLPESINLNQQSKIFRRFIKLTNLVPFDAQIEFYALEFGVPERQSTMMFDEPYGYFIEYWTKNHDVKTRYPKLYRYLSFVAKKEGSSWQNAFEDFKKVREFMKTLLEIAEAYQKIHQETNNLITYSESTENHFLINMSKWRILEENFNISYRAGGLILPSRFQGYMVHKSEQEYPGLGKRLFDAAFSFISLKVNGHHQAEISLGGFLDLIKGTDLRRLKKCRTCFNVFWARRLNKAYCSTRCANLYYQRLYQSDPLKRLQYNAIRRGTYQSKQEQKLAKARRHVMTG